MFVAGEHGFVCVSKSLGELREREWKTRLCVSAAHVLSAAGGLVGRSCDATAVLADGANARANANALGDWGVARTSDQTTCTGASGKGAFHTAESNRSGAFHTAESIRSS